jgi:hypothetical protein
LTGSKELSHLRACRMRARQRAVRAIALRSGCTYLRRLSQNNSSKPVRSRREIDAGLPTDGAKSTLLLFPALGFRNGIHHAQEGPRGTAGVTLAVGEYVELAFGQTKIDLLQETGLKTRRRD